MGSSAIDIDFAQRSREVLKTIVKLAKSRGYTMRKSAILALAAVASFGLVACSEQTQDAAEATADSAASDAAGAANRVGEAADAAAADARKAVDKAAASTDELGAKVEQKAAEVEADAHNESVSEAKAD